LLSTGIFSAEFSSKIIGGVIMRILSILAVAIFLAFWPAGSGMLAVQAAEAVSVSEPAGAAPVSQPLIREGDFALKLAEELHIATTDNEAEAESELSAAGIAPQNGWIADYPVTPDIMTELGQDIVRAADAGKLPIGKDEALGALQTVADDFGLYVEIGLSGAEIQATGPPASAESYVAPTVVNNYYSEYGPPVVTYYPPPLDYYYLYAWVPSPFWWFDFYYPGFFILHDFDRVVFFHGRHARLLTNHVYHHRTGSFFVLDRHGRDFSHRYGRHSNIAGSSVSRGFLSPTARRGAESILRGRLEQFRGLRGGVPRAGLPGGEFRGGVLHGGGSRGVVRGGRSPAESRETFLGHGPHEGRSSRALRHGFRGRESHGGRFQGAFRGHGFSHEGRSSVGFHNGFRAESHSRGFGGAVSGGGFRDGSHNGSGFRAHGFHGGGLHGGGFHRGGGFHGGRR
jgi:hypothetical protein